MQDFNILDQLEKFRGSLIPAAPVFYDENWALDTECLECYGRWIKRQPVNAVAVGSDIGLFSDGYFKCSLETIQSLHSIIGGAVPIIAGLGANLNVGSILEYSQAALTLAEIYREYSSYFLLNLHQRDAFRDRTLHPEIFQFLKELASLGNPIIIDINYITYENMRDGYKVATCLDPLLALDGMIGIRSAIGSVNMLMTPGTINTISHMIMEHPGKVLLTGDSAFYGYTFYRGCHGALMDIGSIYPLLQRELIDSWMVRETSDFLSNSQMMDILVEGIYSNVTAWRNSLFYALAYLGIIPMRKRFEDTMPGGSVELITSTLDALREWRDD